MLRGAAGAAAVEAFDAAVFAAEVFAAAAAGSVFMGGTTEFEALADVDGRAAFTLSAESALRPFIKTTVTATETAAVASNPTITSTVESRLAERCGTFGAGLKGATGRGCAAKGTVGPGWGYEFGAGGAGIESLRSTGAPQSRQKFWPGLAWAPQCLHKINFNLPSDRRGRWAQRVAED